MDVHLSYEFLRFGAMDDSFNRKKPRAGVV
jgi:hypothetical protein